MVVSNCFFAVIECSGFQQTNSFILLRPLLLQRRVFVPIHHGKVCRNSRIQRYMFLHVMLPCTIIIRYFNTHYQKLLKVKALKRLWKGMFYCILILIKVTFTMFLLCYIYCYFRIFDKYHKTMISLNRDDDMLLCTGNISRKFMGTACNILAVKLYFKLKHL